MNGIYKYCKDVFHYHRRKTRVVYVGNVGVGGDNPIRIQSMTIADTTDTRATVNEIVQLAEVGCEIVRVTAPSIREAENLKNIKEELKKRGVKVPLVADIHYTPNAALIAAEHVEKVRINPGNYADKKKFEQREYTDEEYQLELERLENKFKPLVLKCRALGRAIRIGTNHGSLSDRIMNRYGDTSEGMVESALEFVRICEKYNFRDIILSMKSSNPQIAIQAYRLLAARMDELGMDYPFHLGVTEAGDGEEARIKSAIGIGALLEDGIGDTIRVSLTEDSVAEVPVAIQIAEKYNRPRKAFHDFAPREVSTNGSEIRLPNPFEYCRRQTLDCNLGYHQLGSRHIPRVELTLLENLADTDSVLSELSAMFNQRENGKLKLGAPTLKEEEFKCETVHLKIENDEELNQFRNLNNLLKGKDRYAPIAVDATEIPDRIFEISKFADRIVFSPGPRQQAVQCRDVIRAAQSFGKPIEWKIALPELEGCNFESIAETVEEVLNACNLADYWNIIFSLVSHNAIIFPYRYLAARLDALGANIPILLRYRSGANFPSILLDASTQLGSLLCEGIGDAIHIDAALPANDLLRLSYNILQATRLRISKTEFISCPSCGRTLFDLQTTTARIKAKTDHLKGVKIAIMGCIVNGPGEMADANFGYVGAGPQKVNLFVGKECVKRNIPEDVADEELIELIKSHGKWVEP